MKLVSESRPAEDILKESPKKCLSRKVTLLSLPYRETDSCDIDKTFSDNRLLTGKEFFQQLDSSFDPVHYFNTGLYIQSIFGEDKTILYYDDNHLSHQGSLFITPYLEDELMSFENTKSQI